MSLETGAGH